MCFCVLRTGESAILTRGLSFGQFPKAVSGKGLNRESYGLRDGGTARRLRRFLHSFIQKVNRTATVGPGDLRSAGPLPPMALEPKPLPRS